MFTKLFRPRPWDRSETTTEPAKSTTTESVLHMAALAVNPEDAQFPGAFPSASLTSIARTSELAHLPTNSRAIAEGSPRINIEDGSAAPKLKMTGRQQEECFRKETDEERMWREDEETTRQEKERKCLRLEKERLWKEAEERVKEEDEQLRKAKGRCSNSNFIAPSDSPKVDTNCQDGTEVGVILEESLSGSAWLSLNGSTSSIISIDSQDPGQKLITQEDAKKAGERTKIQIEVKAKKEQAEEKEKEGLRKEAEDDDRIWLEAEENAGKAAEAEARREHDLEMERLPKDEEEKVRVRLRLEAQENARKAAEAEAKRKQGLELERLHKDEEEKARVRLLLETEENARKTAKAEARRKQELEMERLRKDEEEKERMRLRLEAQENARKAAEADAKQERGLEKEGLRKDQVRIGLDAKREQLRKMGEEQARKVVEVEVKRTQKLEEERLRKEEARLRLENKVSRKSAALAVEAKREDRARKLEEERARKDEEDRERAREVTEQAEAGRLKNGQEKDRIKGLRIETANLRRKVPGALDMFYVLGNDSIPASLPSAPATAHIIDDIDSIICPDSMMTPKAAKPSFDAKDSQLKNNRDFLLQFMRHLTRSTVAAPLNLLAEKDRADRAEDSSHQTNPIEWTRFNREYVADITRLLFDQICVTVACDVNKVYPRLTLYTLACIMFNSIFPENTKHTKLSDALKALKIWNSWDDIAALAHHQPIRNYLLSSLKSISEMHATRDDDPDGFHRATTLDHVLKMDANAIDALLLQTLQNPVKYQQLVARRGQEAQSLLNLLQARLGFPLDPSLKRFHTGALIKLSRTSGLYPECMTLKGTKLMGKAALDAGSFGDIWKGSLGGQEICIKVLKVFQKSDKVKLLKEFSSEAVIWRQLNHPNVLPFYGVFHLEDDRLCLASPWMSNGNVVRFLETAPETKRLPLILDIAEGLKYLHTLKPSIIHGDMKGVNILITQSHRACLADFGLATAKDSKSFAVKSGASVRATGTLRWQAPELLDPDADDASCGNTLASDVYAYACVCYEIFSGEVPFYEIKNDFRVMAAVTKGTRPARPSYNICRTRGLDHELWSIIESCWTDEPINRPTTHQIVERLRSLSALKSDERPLDIIDPSFPSRRLYSQAEHPFSALPGH